MTHPTPGSESQSTTPLAAPAAHSTDGQTTPAAPEQQMHGSYPPVAPQAPRPTTLAAMNAYALIAIVLAFVQPIAGIVFGHMGLSQIKRNGDTGRGVALTALIIGYVMVFGVIIAVISYFAFIAIMIATMGAAFSGFEPSDFDTSF